MESDWFLNFEEGKIGKIGDRPQLFSVYYRWRPNLRDEADNHLIELTVACGADYLVTRNIKDFFENMLYLNMIDSFMLQHKDRFRDSARRLVWWMKPEEALEQPLRLVAQIMEIGSLSDIRLLQKEFTDNELVNILSRY